MSTIRIDAVTMHVIKLYLQNVYHYFTHMILILMVLILVGQFNDAHMVALILSELVLMTLVLIALVLEVQSNVAI